MNKKATITGYFVRCLGTGVVDGKEMAPEGARYSLFLIPMELEHGLRFYVVAPTVEGEAKLLVQFKAPEVCDVPVYDSLIGQGWFCGSLPTNRLRSIPATALGELILHLYPDVNSMAKFTVHSVNHRVRHTWRMDADGLPAEREYTVRKIVSGGKHVAG